MLIGRLLVAQTPAEKREEAIFEIVNQLNRGRGADHPTRGAGPAGRVQPARGQTREGGHRLRSALTLSQCRVALLAEDRWARTARADFCAGAEWGGMRVPAGNLEEAEQRLCSTFDPRRNHGRARRRHVPAGGYCICPSIRPIARLRSLSDYLRHLGMEWSPHPTEAEARQEYERIWSQLDGRAIEKLIDLPLMNDAASLATLDVITKLCAAGHVYRHEPGFPGHLQGGQSQPRAVATMMARPSPMSCFGVVAGAQARRLPGRISLWPARL